MRVIADRPPPEMYATCEDIDLCCARCGSDCDYTRCDCNDGYDGHDCGEDCCPCLEPEENVICETCNGAGGWNTCMSSPEWCKANPLPRRENVERGAIEWFTTSGEDA